MLKLEALLENHSEYFAVNTGAISSVENLADVILDQEKFDDYSKTILGENASQGDKALFARHRQSLIEEAATFTTPQAVAFAIASFPLLVDIYSDDLLADGIFQKVSAVPSMTLTRLRIVASKIDLDGNVVKVNLPNGTVDLRNERKEISFDNGTRGNIFTKLNITDTELYSISSKGLKPTKVSVVTDGNLATAEEFAVPSAVIDARGTLRVNDFKVTLANGNFVEIGISGDINIGTGLTNMIASVLDTDSLGAMTIISVKVAVRLIAQGGSKGFVKVKPESESIDIVADVADSFEIEEIEEVLQDWTSIYKKSVISDASAVVKTQIAVNKNFEIADALADAEAAMEANGTKVIKTLSGSTDLSPTKLKDVFENIIPQILKVSKKIKTVSGLTPNVIFAGQNTAVLLESLQDFVTSFTGAGATMGVTTRISDITKFKILSSPAIEEGKLYLGRKGATEKDSSLVDLVYKALYMIKETTNAKEKTYIRSRTRIEVAREESLGLVVISDIDLII